MIPLLLAIVMCTGSMEPEFTCNQSIQLTPEFNFTHGEVYVYNQSDRLIMHRLQWTTRDWVVFKADRGLYYERVPRGDVLYKVVTKRS